MKKDAYRDSALSLKAKGVLAIIESLGGKAKKQDITACCQGQRSAVTSALVELRAKGIVESVLMQDASGKFRGTLFRLTEKKDTAGRKKPAASKEKKTEKKTNAGADSGTQGQSEFDLGDETFVSMIYGSRPVEIPRSYVESMKVYYPDINVEQAVRDAAAFATSHEKRYAHNTQWKGYITNWLKTETAKMEAKDNIRNSQRAALRSGSPDATDQYRNDSVGVTL